METVTEHPETAPEKSSAWKQAVSELTASLKIGVAPGEVPVGRERQFETVQAFIAECSRQHRGGVAYLSGLSGTGRTFGMIKSGSLF